MSPGGTTVTGTVLFWGMNALLGTVGALCLWLLNVSWARQNDFDYRLRANETSIEKVNVIANDVSWIKTWAQRIEGELKSHISKDQ